MTVTEKLTAFVRKDRERFDTVDGNLFAHSLGEVIRYYEFLTKIINRYRTASKGFMDNFNKLQKTYLPGNHPLTDEQQLLMEKEMELTNDLHFEIESYYLFSKILLDKVARFLEFYFDQVRGRSLDSHDDLVKNLQHYAKEKNLSFDSKLIELISKLKVDISDYRDYKIAHEKSPRITRGTVFQSDGKTRLYITKLYPKEKEVKQMASESENKFIDDLQIDINKYIDLVIEFLERNMSKTGLSIKQSDN